MAERRHGLTCMPGQLAHVVALCTEEETPDRVAVFTVVLDTEGGTRDH